MELVRLMRFLLHMIEVYHHHISCCHFGTYSDLGTSGCLWITFLTESSRNGSVIRWPPPVTSRGHWPSFQENRIIASIDHVTVSWWDFSWYKNVPYIYSACVTSWNSATLRHAALLFDVMEHYYVTSWSSVMIQWNSGTWGLLLRSRARFVSCIRKWARNLIVKKVHFFTSYVSAWRAITTRMIPFPTILCIVAVS